MVGGGGGSTEEAMYPACHKETPSPWEFNCQAEVWRRPAGPGKVGREKAEELIPEIYTDLEVMHIQKAREAVLRQG